VSIGLVSKQAAVPNIEPNKCVTPRAVQILWERKGRKAVFPESSHSGCSWADETACRRYREKAAIENQKRSDWMNNSLKPLMDAGFGTAMLDNAEHDPEKNAR